jgi:hypothetical protein
VRPLWQVLASAAAIDRALEHGLPDDAAVDRALEHGLPDDAAVALIAARQG